jgi:acyl-CoA synthetase (AMP-forming)/AMP-acid ligase II
MLPSDLDLARLCAASYSDASAFDYVDNGAQTGVWVAVKKLPDVDVIVFRGSDDVEDWLRDFDAAMISTPLGLVHAGFYKNMDAVILDVRPCPVITGHSLGAARAAIYAAMQQHTPAHLALFGCPRPGAEALAQMLEVDSISSYKNRSDPVTDVPMTLPDFPYVHVRDFIPSRWQHPERIPRSSEGSPYRVLREWIGKIEWLKSLTFSPTWKPSSANTGAMPAAAPSSASSPSP